MTTSGTNTFNPASGQLIPYCFSLCGIRRSALEVQHLEDARMALNLTLGGWGNSTPNLWTIDLQEVTLIDGQTEYDVPADTIMILDAYIRTSTGESQLDRIIWPISRTEYASQPNKNTRAPPTTFWFDRLLSPTITLWQTPDDQQTYTLRYYRCITIQDANLQNGETLDIPPIWLNALAWTVAAALAASYAPERAQGLQARADTLLTQAHAQNTENVPLYIMPMIGGYHPR